MQGKEWAVVNGRASRGVRRGKGDSVPKQGSRPGEYTKEESVGSENLAKAQVWLGYIGQEGSQRDAAG